MSEPLLSEKELTRLRRLALAGVRVQRASARGERATRQFGAGQEFAAHRAYITGDDLRRVDWNVYGRLGQLFLKLFEAPGRLRVVIGLDASPTMDFGAHNKWLAARRTAAACAVMSLSGADRVWLGTLDSTPQSFEGAAEARLVETLSGMKCAPAAQASPRALLQQVAAGGADTVLMLLSDFQDRAAPMALLQECHRRGGRAAALCVHATEELNPAMEGFARLCAPGFDDLKLRLDARLLELYRQEVSRLRAATAAAVRATGAAWIEIDSAAPMEPVITSLSRAGMLASRPG
ncbi:MAG: DUF58 domain-containing protein [Planctomycetes bacterium]|nr:DUF58 domain-containing protein [Planctomycetota bacterium]